LIRKTLPKSNLGPITTTPFSSSATAILSQPKSAFSFTAFSSAAATSVTAVASNNIMQVANQMQKVAEDQKQVADTKITTIMNELFKHVPRSDVPISIQETIDARMAARDSAGYSNDLCSDLPLTDAQEERPGEVAATTAKKSNKRTRKGKDDATTTPPTPLASATVLTPTSIAPPTATTPSKDTKSRKKPKKEK